MQKVLKLSHGPAAKICGVFINAMYGKCLSNIASRQYFNLEANEGNNNNFNDDNVILQQPVIYAVADDNTLSTDGPNGV